MISPRETQETRLRSPRPRKKKVMSTDRFKEPSIELDSFLDEHPFQEDELSTLDELESLLKKPASSRKKPVSLERIDQASTSKPKALQSKPKKARRRRQIDPATCERDYTPDEIEFMNALSEYKRCSGRMFPTCSEILEVLKTLGYEKTVKGLDEN